MAHYHFIGIGGAGLAPIARVLLERGHQVSGSDLIMSPMAQELKNMGVKVTLGHHSDNVFGADLIIRSSAIPDDNVEVAAGLNAHVQVIKRSDFLEFLTSDREVIAVAGSHGKTTTTAMLALCLTDAGMDPSFVIGGVSKNLGANGHAGDGNFFIIEADEYDRMFLGLSPKILVVTNIEYDHPDCFRNKEEYFQAFLAFAQKMASGGVLIGCSDQPGAARLMAALEGQVDVLGYGAEPASRYQIEAMRHSAAGGISFTLKIDTIDYAVSLPIPGNHNAYNAAAAIAAACSSGLSVEDAIDSLSRFIGTGRRFEIKGVQNGITVIDDYAHHPTAIRATISAARCRYPQHALWVVWQPHTYSRTREMLEDFSRAFADADHVIVTEIYPSREMKSDYSSQEVVAKMEHPDARYVAELPDVTRFLTGHLTEGDILLVLSAGDADQVSRDVLHALQHHGRKQA